MFSSIKEEINLRSVLLKSEAINKNISFTPTEIEKCVTTSIKCTASLKYNYVYWSSANVECCVECVRTNTYGNFVAIFKLISIHNHNCLLNGTSSIR